MILGGEWVMYDPAADKICVIDSSLIVRVKVYHGWIYLGEL